MAADLFSLSRSSWCLASTGGVLAIGSSPIECEGVGRFPLRDVLMRFDQSSPQV